MSAAYPAGVKSFPAINTGDTVQATDPTSAYDEITAIETALINGMGHDLKFTDALYDIGKTGATRPRDLFLSRNAVIGGTLTVPVTTITATGNQDDLSFSNGGTLRCNNATLLTIRGLAAGVDGQRLTITSVGAGQVDLSDQNTNSVAANRLICGPTATISLAAGVGKAILEYDGTTARWRVIAHEQGAWITPAFAAGNFASSSGTFVVAAGDVTTYAYYLKGRTLSVAVEVVTATVTGTPTTLTVAIPGGFTAAKQATAALVYSDGGANDAIGKARVTAAGTVINCTKGLGVGNFAASADLTVLETTLTFEVQ